ncbi:MAG TPA: chloride channel protein, partial [Burkholderiales bacterium]|nr:chloride channel protein [Burkholderiales bacterium]
MQNRFYRRSKYIWLSTAHWKRRLIFWGGAICVGIIAVLFAVAAAYANAVFHDLLAVSPYLPLIVSPLGLALVVAITRKYFPGSQGSGIPQTIAALKISDPEARESVLSLKIAIGKMFMTLLALFSGASAGREGPTVQIGASIMHALGKWGFFSRVDAERSLILAGGAAGVAAAFNTPLAGIVFAIEEMSRSFEERTSGAVLTAIIVAGMASLAMLGNYTYFGHTNDSLGFRQGWLYVLICGITGGIMGGLFSLTLLNAGKMLPAKAAAFMKDKPVHFAATCGFILAVIGILSGSSTYGTGYTEAKHILEGTASIPQDYGILKMIAT